MHPRPDLRSRFVAVLAACLVCASVHAADRSTSFNLDGAVASPATYDLERLRALPAVTQRVVFGAQAHHYVGADLYALVVAAGIVTRPGAHNDALSKIVLAT